MLQEESGRVQWHRAGWRTAQQAGEPQHRSLARNKAPSTAAELGCYQILVYARPCRSAGFWLDPAVAVTFAYTVKTLPSSRLLRSGGALCKQQRAAAAEDDQKLMAMEL